MVWFSRAGNDSLLPFKDKGQFIKSQSFKPALKGPLKICHAGKETQKGSKASAGISDFPGYGRDL